LPSRDSEQGSLGKIRSASERLRVGDYDKALGVLGTPGADDRLGQSLVLAARGARLEQEGDVPGATACFEQVREIGIPLPVLLKMCGEHFGRAGQYELAFECYSLLRQARPRAIRDFVTALPGRWLVRYAPVIVASEPGLYALQPLKAALARELGPEAAAFVFAKVANYEPGFTVTHRRIVGLRECSRSNAAAFEELIASRRVLLPGPPLFGARRERGVEATTRTVFFGCLSDVVIASRSSFILRGDDALIDAQDDELARVELDLDVDPVVFGPDGKSATFLVPRAASSRPPLERALSLTGVGSHSFGHWMLEYLPKAIACLRRPGFDSVAIVIDAHMPRQHREALKLFVGDDHPVVVLDARDAVRVEELWVCSAIAYLPIGPKPGHAPDVDVVTRPDSLIIDADAFAELLAVIQPTLAGFGHGAGPKRIYLARTDRQHRQIVNRLEVEEWFAAHGFAIVNFGDIEFREQLELVRGADVIVGPDGSSTFTTFFARPGTRIGLLANAFAEDNEWYALVCEALDQQLLILTGEVVEENPDYRDFSSYRIDVGRLAEFVDDLSSDR
jgi:hypothetical protein